MGRRYLSLTIVLFGLFFALDSQAQYHREPHRFAGINPGEVNDGWDGGFSSTWDQLLGQVNARTWSQKDTLPFYFEFAGQPVDAFKVSSTGVLTFDTAATAVPDSNNEALPSTAIPDSSIMVWGMEARNANSAINTKTFGTAPNRQYWISFKYFELPYNGTKVMWSIVLEESTHRIYIVDQYKGDVTGTGLTAGIQLDGSTAWSLKDSPNLSGTAGRTRQPEDNSYYTFYLIPQPDRDMSVVEEEMENYLALDSAPFTIRADIRSYGAQTVNSADIEYRVNGGPVKTHTENQGINPYGYWYNYEHPVTWSPSGPGHYTIEMWASNINGGSDQFSRNDTLRFSVEVSEESRVRNSLIEGFTSSSCPPCAPDGDSLKKRIFDQVDHYTAIKYPQDYPGGGDPYAYQESDYRRFPYGVNGIPYTFLDGLDQWGFNYDTADFYEAQKRPAFLDISFDTAYYKGDSVFLDVNYEALVDFNLGHDYRAHLVIIEKLTEDNEGGNGESEFHYTLMDMVPDEDGRELDSLTRGTIFEVSDSLDMSNTNVEEMHDLKAVAFFQRHDQYRFSISYDDYKNQVYQSTWRDIVDTSSTSTSIAEKDERSMNFELRPNPSQGSPELWIDTEGSDALELRVYDLSGTELLHRDLGPLSKGTHRKQLDLEQLSIGSYLLHIRSDEGSTTKKLMIRR